MPDADDMELVREFARSGSEMAFAGLVRRHINLVYSVAWRYTGQAQDAEDVTQAVFIILAKKASGLRAGTILTGWLYETTRFTASRLLRTKARRAIREQEACMESTLSESETVGAWRQLAPHLEDAMSGLAARDRTLLALRFYENMSGAEAAALLGIREAAAHKRTARALEKLRKFFSRCGIVLSAAAIAGAVSANSVHAAPSGLAEVTSAAALAKGAAAGGSTLTLVKGALKLMAWTKAKSAVLAGVVVLMAAGTTTVTVREIQEHRAYPWQTEGRDGIFDSSLLDRQPPQVRILPSKFKASAEGQFNSKMMGTGLPAQEIVASAFGGSSARTIFSTGLPEGRFDYIASLPDGNPEALQREVKRKFGVTGKFQTREWGVLLLQAKSQNPPALKRSSNSKKYMMWRDSGTRLELRHAPLSQLASEMQFLSNIAIMDGTGLADSFDFDLNCTETDVENQNWDKVNQALDPLGLELVATNMPIKMLVVEKAGP